MTLMSHLANEICLMSTAYTLYFYLYQEESQPFAHEMKSAGKTKLLFKIEEERFNLFSSCSQGRD